MTSLESRGVTKLLAKIKDSMDEKKYYEGSKTETSRRIQKESKLSNHNK